MFAELIVMGAMMGAATDSVSNAEFVAYAISQGYPQCATEDAIGPCYWDATTQGNQKGTSFVVTDDGEVFYLK